MITIRLSDSGCFPLFLYGVNFYSGIFLLGFLIIGIGCSKWEVVRAFDGEFNSHKNNKVIGQYCTSCHIHKGFDSEQHVAEVSSGYKRRLFRTTTECRICHYLEKQWVHSGVLRKTRRSAGANRGDYRKFEKKHMKSR